MTATASESGVASGAAAGVVAGVVGVTADAKECQNRNGARRDECQDVDANERHWHGDDMSGGGEGGEEDSREKTHPHLRPLNQHHHHHHHLRISQQHHSKSHQNLQNGSNQHQEKNHESEAAYQLVPPDGGWGWVVALGTFIIMVAYAMPLERQIPWKL